MGGGSNIFNIGTAKNPYMLAIDFIQIEVSTYSNIFFTYNPNLHWTSFEVLKLTEQLVNGHGTNEYLICIWQYFDMPNL